jgi:hypothetical protein
MQVARTHVKSARTESMAQLGFYPLAREAQILWFAASQGFLRRFHRRMYGESRRDREQLSAERHLARVKQRSARDRETMSAGFAPPAGRSIGATAIINDGAAAFGAERVAAIAGPADLAEDGLGFLIRHLRDRR